MPDPSPVRTLPRFAPAARRCEGHAPDPLQPARVAAACDRYAGAAGELYHQYAHTRTAGASRPGSRRDVRRRGVGSGRGLARVVLTDRPGERWASIADAAADMGLTHSAVSNALAGRTALCAGRRWFGVPAAWQDQLEGLLRGLRPGSAVRASGAGRRSLW